MVAPASSDEALRLGDGLTYAAKTSGKDTAVFDVVTGTAESVPRTVRG